MKISKLSKSQRQQLIVDKLKEFPAIRVSELSRDINVSTETIRRDLDELESQGLISRTYGGATPAMNHEPTFRQRQQMHPHQYDLIARSASEIVKNGEVLIIGSSVTTLQLAVRLAAEKRICVYLLIHMPSLQLCHQIHLLKFMCVQVYIMTMKVQYMVLRRLII